MDTPETPAQMPSEDGARLRSAEDSIATLRARMRDCKAELKQAQQERKRILKAQRPAKAPRSR